MILRQRHGHRFFLDAVEFFHNPVYHTKSFNKLKILKGFLVKHRPVAGNFLIIFLEIPHLPHRIPGCQKGNRRSHQRNRSHNRIMSHHNNKCPPKANECRHHIREKGEDRIRHHTRIPVNPV